MAEKKESVPAPAESPALSAVNQQVVEVLLRLLNDAQQRASTFSTQELPKR